MSSGKRTAWLRLDNDGCSAPPAEVTGRVWFANAMPTAASFRSRLVAREPLYGAWSVIPSPLSVRLLAAAGVDYVVIDLQHGGAVEADLPAMTGAIRLAGAAPVARVRHAHTADIGRALDLGCEGVIVPNVDSAAQARQVASAVRYPPVGHRSVGGVLAVAEPFCLVMAESADAVDDLDATLAVDGVDGLYVGPGDLSLSLGCASDPDDPVLSRALQRVWTACAAAGKPVGVHATNGATARRFSDAGCTLITAAADAVSITRDTAAQLGRARAG
jgi:4-hydroxy-2-oxoheptanedioate aldolase